jgi:hypothetical protein
MIKLVAHAEDGGIILMLGLSDRNLERLQAGDPIRFDPAELGLPWKGLIGIFHGKTEADMAQMLKDHGLIGPGTEIVGDEPTTGAAGA